MSERMPEQGSGSRGSGGQDPRWRISPTKWVVAALLGVGIVAPLLVSTYDQVEPRLFGFPFFYWYQLLWVFLAAGICALCYVLLQRERAAHERAHGRGQRDGDAR